MRQYQWYLTPLKFAQAQQITRGDGVVVAVVDTPIYAAHRDLSGQLLEGTSTGGGPSNGWGDGSAGNAHGTEVASVIVGKGGGGDHMLGIAPAAKILPVAYSAGGDGTSKAASDGIRWAADHGAKVINVSNGHKGEALGFEVDAIRYAISKDVVVVAGVGNTAEGMQSVISPANIPGVVAVSGVDTNGNFWSGSAFGPETVVAAPAAEMSVATVPSGFPSGYGLDEGTSLATAIVSGVVALIRAKYPRMNAANVINRLIRTARDNGDPGRDRYFGFGTIQPLAALTADVPTVTENPLGGPPAASRTATLHAVPPPRTHTDGNWALALLLIVPAGVLLLLVKLFLFRPRRLARRVAGYPQFTAGYPPGPVGAFPPQWYPPPANAPPTMTGYPPGGFPRPAPPGQYPPRGFPPAAPPGQYPPGGFPPAAPPGQYPPGGFPPAAPPGQYPPGGFPPAAPPGQYPPGVTGVPGPDSAVPVPLRVAAVFDAVDDEGRPYFSADRRRVVDPGEREALAKYLESAPLVVRASGFEVDPLNPGAGRVVPLGYRTDGVWVWQQAAAYYLRSRGAAPDEDLVRHIESVGFRFPESVPDEVAGAAATLAFSASPPEPATGRRAATYFASVDSGYPAHAPAGLLRQWYDERGYQHDESLQRSMRWEHTGAFIANSRSGEKDFVEIPPQLAARIADDWWPRRRLDVDGA